MVPTARSETVRGTMTPTGNMTRSLGGIAPAAVAPLHSSLPMLAKVCMCRLWSTSCVCSEIGSPGGQKLRFSPT